MSVTIAPSTRLGEVKLRVSSLERSLTFYTDVVGFKLLDRKEGAARLTVDGKQPLLLLEEAPGARIVPRRSAAGLYHVAILLPDRAQLGLVLRNLIRSGIHIGHSDHLVSEALYITDPDLHGIELYADRPRSAWTRDERGYYRMATEPIDWDGLMNASESLPWHGLPSETVIGHIHFHVKRLDEAKAFYCDVLGFEMAADEERRGALFVSAGGYHHHIGLNIWAGIDAPSPTPPSTGLAFYTIVLPDRAELERVLGRVREAGIQVGERDGGWLLQDPSDISLRLTVAEA